MLLWREIAIFSAWLGGSIVLFFITGLLWDHVLLPVSRRTRLKFDTLLLEALRGPARWVATAVILNIGASASFNEVPAVRSHWGWAIFTAAVYVLLVISLTVATAAAAKAVMQWYLSRQEEGESEKRLAPVILLVSKTTNVLLAFIALTVILGNFGVQISGLLATAGVASLALALAAQETLSNFFAGVAIILDKPFQIGDRIELPDGQVGDVVEIGMRTTRIISFDNTLIAIPNAEIAKSRIINQSAPNPQYKIRMRIGVAYGTDIRQAKALLLDIINAHPDVMKSPAPAVYFEDFGESALMLFLVFWIPDYREKFRIKDEINMAIKDRFEAANIEIPFPQRDVHVRHSAPFATPAALPEQNGAGFGKDSGDA